MFYNCLSENPEGRRRFCYNHEALEPRKEYKPENSVVNITKEMGIEILEEKQ
ncbi:DUF4256 domain-containing protein [Arachidicoccus sp.]|uniref:DUF4256 domain-containing protein n=1 Tax=Arachidicoccus sp. TaxID=1872624 RepID=UPI003D2424B4